MKTLIGTAGLDQMLVVGSRGPSAVGGMLGSVSYRCVQYAKGPVVVVPSSITALRFAAQATAVRGGVLHVVHGWLNRVSGYGGWPRPLNNHWVNE